MLGYVSFRVSDGAVFDTWVHVSHSIRLPDGRRFFRAKLSDDMVIMVTSEEEVPEVGGFVSQVVHIFDKSFKLSYEENLEIIFRLTDKTTEWCAAYVTASTPIGATNLGMIKLFSDGRVLYDGKPCDTRDMLRLYTKVMMVVGY